MIFVGKRYLEGNFIVDVSEKKIYHIIKTEKLIFSVSLNSCCHNAIPQINELYFYNLVLLKISNSSCSICMGTN